MNLTTFEIKHKYVVFKSTWNGEYSYIQIRPQQMFLQVDSFFIPILYTNNVEIALEAVKNLERGNVK